MKVDRSLELFSNYCRSRQLRPRTMQTYRQSIRLFAAWLRGRDVEEIHEMTIRDYILDLQERGKYAACYDARTKAFNCPEHRTDYMERLSNTTINGYLRTIRVYLNWLVLSNALAVI